MRAALKNPRIMEATMIPMSKDVRELIGPWAEQVDNRALLYEKYALPKVWGEPRKIDNAGRWNVLRIVTRGSALLSEDAQRLRSEANGPNVQPEVAEKKRTYARIAESMAKVGKFDTDLVQAWNENAQKFMDDLRKSYPERLVTFEATLQSRLMINMAGGVVENAGICLDRCFGLPFLPGSAVKGIARNQALWEIKRASGQEKKKLLDAALLLFGYAKPDLSRNGAFGWAAGADLGNTVTLTRGTNEFKGLACFLPAYPTTKPKLVVDLVNSHYPNYYKGRHPNASDNEEPRPNYFPAVESGCSFGFAVVLTRWFNGLPLSEEEILGHARKWIENALTKNGAGAKTAAGYGWFQVGRTAPTQAQPAAGMNKATPADAFIDQWRGKLNTKDNFPAALPAMNQLDDDGLKRAFEAVIPEQERRRLRRKNPYWQSFTSGRHAEAGKSILKRLNLQLT
ncbi:type III-B CRISPR module RAMP protein Cmr6 [Fontisphaera persica]|uniref:type III-B CRISPR module RAMP protein Cmr6 n=1 Tax=Fontisphaera persica TaxID=2974023 RepID=UPI0024BFD919|nr:type III-B CRISPR module RAMP protein Cmr6 [Fontisphaera persica]WCJ60670.1 type III-B CRISPR module RAMP protein Cmr6 [Fontisphaera persica]